MLLAAKPPAAVKELSAATVHVPSRLPVTVTGAEAGPSSPKALTQIATYTRVSAVATVPPEGVTVKVPVVPSSTEGSPVQVPPMTVGELASASPDEMLKEAP